MALIARRELGELSVNLTDEPGNKVEIGQVGLEYKYSISVSSLQAAIDELSRIVAWLVMQKEGEE
jgi:hypothetical protein